MDPVEIMVKEYETLREESLAAIRARNSILSFGQAAMGAVLAASIAAYAASGTSALSGLMLVLVVPAIANFALSMWLGEYERMQRAGKFLEDLEGKINDRMQEKLLTWETRLREQQSHMRYPYSSAIVLLEIASFMSMTIGLAILELHLALKWVLVVGGLIAHVIVWRYVTSRIAKLQL
jgi:hypothetical protein